MDINAEEIAFLEMWLFASLVVAAIFVTAFPLMYSFSPWYRSALGRALMFKAIAFALAVDCTLLFVFWQPPLEVAYWISILVYSCIAVTTAGLAWMLWYNNYYKKEIYDDSKRVPGREPRQQSNAE